MVSFEPLLGLVGKPGRAGTERRTPDDLRDPLGKPGRAGTGLRGALILVEMVEENPGGRERGCERRESNERS